MGLPVRSTTWLDLVFVSEDLNCTQCQSPNPNTRVREHSPNSSQQTRILPKLEPIKNTLHIYLKQKYIDFKIFKQLFLFIEIIYNIFCKLIYNSIKLYENQYFTQKN